MPTERDSWSQEFGHHLQRNENVKPEVLGYLECNTENRQEGAVVETEQRAQDY